MGQQSFEHSVVRRGKDIGNFDVDEFFFAHGLFPFRWLLYRHRGAARNIRLLPETAGLLTKRQ
jgi:hypothetical protein